MAATEIGGEKGRGAMEESGGVQHRQRRRLVRPECLGICARMWFFFFQAEDGIRDLTVTGVQTCALPISRPLRARCAKRLSATAWMNKEPYISGLRCRRARCAAASLPPMGRWDRSFTLTDRKSVV